MLRRTLLSATVLLPIAACTATALTPQLIVDEAVAITKGLTVMLGQVTATYPGLIPPASLNTMQSEMALASSAAAALAANVPAATGAATVQTVMTYINAVLDTLAGPPINGLIPAPYNMAVGAAALLAPELEAFVTASIKTPTAAASPQVAASRSRLRAKAPLMIDKTQALKLLQSLG
jgi:hypothetical protein